MTHEFPQNWLCLLLRLISVAFSIAVGTVITDRPPHRSVRAELPHTVLTLDIDVQTSRLHVHPTIRATWLPTVSRSISGSVSGPVATARCSPWSVPFPPPTPQALAPSPCSLVSSVLWNCVTPRPRPCRTCGLAPSPTDPLPWKKRMLAGSLGFREESFQPCLWSLTPWGPRRTRRDRST